MIAPDRARAQIGAVAWIFALQFFITQVVVASAWATPFSLAHRYISDLGNTACAPYPAGSGTLVCSPWHLAMNASFVLLGVTMMIGAVQARDAFAPGRIHSAARTLFVLAGIGVILVGLYPENENNSRHYAGAALNFLCGNVALVLFGLAVPVRKSALAQVSIGAGVIGLLATALLVSERYLGLGAGGMERLAAYPMSLWQIVAGLSIWSRIAHPVPSGPAD